MLAAKWQVPEERHVLLQTGKWTKALTEPEQGVMHMLKMSSMGDPVS